MERFKSLKSLKFTEVQQRETPVWQQDIVSP